MNTGSNRTKITLHAAFLISIFMFSDTAFAGKYLLTPNQEVDADVEMMPHPLYGEAPEVQKNTYYSVQRNEQFQVALRISAKSNMFNKGTAVTLLIKNLSADKTITIKPLMDFIDSTEQVRPVMNMKQILGMLNSEATQKVEQGSFFAYGDPKFVSSAMTGYAIGSIIKSLASSSRSGSASKTAQMIETHWIKDEYRIPPLAQVGAIVLLNGIPQLPLTTRITIDDQIFSFQTVKTESEAEKNLENDLMKTKSN